MRSTTTLATVSAKSTAVGGLGLDGVTTAPGTTVVEGHTFVLRDSVWTDARFQTTLKTVTIRPYSAAWFDLAARMPELKAMFALGDRVIVAGRSVAISVAANGVETLPAADIGSVVKAWE
jgi:hypothetical protein